MASDGTLAYHAIIVARSGAGVASLADLAGKTVAIGAPDSLGARRLQLAGLLSEGVDPSTAFGAVLEVGSAEAAVRLVAAGQADAAFAWSSMTGNVGSGYSRGTLADLVGKRRDRDGPARGRSGPRRRSRTGRLRCCARCRKPTRTRSRAICWRSRPATRRPTTCSIRFMEAATRRSRPQIIPGLETLLAQDVDALRLPGGPATTGATAAAPADAVPASAPAAN